MPTDCKWINADIRTELASEGIVDLFRWQKECLRDPDLLHPVHRNLAYSAPTSAGKTLVAEFLALENVLTTKRKALFVLPYVSVAKEKFFGLQKLWRLADLVVRAYIGSVSTSFEEWDAAVCTIEKANSLLNRICEDAELHKIGVIVIDEIHMMLDPSRGVLIEALLAKILFYNKYSGREKIQIIVMSATFEFQELFAEWLDAKSYTSSFRPVVLEERILIGDAVVDYPRRNESKCRRIPREFQIKNDNGHLIGLCIESVLKGHSVLVFCGTKADTEQQAVGIAKFIEYALAKNVFPQLAQTLDIKKLGLLAERFKAKTFSSDVLIQKAVALGVAFHHAGVTAEEREELEAAFRAGELKILVSTSTLSSGVNLPAHRVLIRAQNNGPSQINRITYKQMVGRAGRQGHTGAGESVLICKAEQVEKICATLCSEERVSPTMMRRCRRRLVLEAVCSGLCTSVEDLNHLYGLTLYGAVQSVESEIASLASNHYIHQQRASVEGSQLGRATLSSSLTPEIAIFVYNDLKLAMQGLCLESELHMLYLVTPFNNSAIWSTYVNWDRYHALWLKLTPESKRIAKSIGVEERFILVRARGTYVDPDNPLLQIHLRFLSTMALLELIGERPLDEVAKQFGIARGLLQSLQQQAATYACMVVAFCDRLGWVYLKTLLDGFAERLAFGVRKDLTELVRIDGVDATRARAFHTAGISSASALALVDPHQIVSILRRSVPYSGTCSHGKNTWLAGEPAMSEMEAAGELVIRARKLIAENLRLMGLFSDSIVDDLVSKRKGAKEADIPDEVEEHVSAAEPGRSLENAETIGTEVNKDSEEFRSQFDECGEAAEYESSAGLQESNQLDETLLDSDSLMLIPTQTETMLYRQSQVEDSFREDQAADSFLAESSRESIVDSDALEHVATEEVDSFLVDDAGLFSQLKIRKTNPLETVNAETNEAENEDTDSEQIIDSFLVDDAGLFSQLKTRASVVSSGELKGSEEPKTSDEAIDSFWVDDAGLFSQLKTANKAVDSNHHDEGEQTSEEAIDSFFIDDCGLFSQLKKRNEASTPNKETEECTVGNEEIELSRILEDISFVEEEEIPRKKCTLSLKRLAVENSRRLTLNANTSLLDSTMSSLGFDRSADLFSSPSPDIRQTKKRARNSAISSPMVFSACRSPFSKIPKSETLKRERNNFEIEDVCRSMQTWRNFTSDALSWSCIGVAVCFSEQDRSLMGISFCSPEGTPKFVTISESAVCGNSNEEALYPSSTPLESIGIREKISFVLSVIESEKPKYVCDFLFTMRAIRSLDVFAAGSFSPAIRNCVCLKTLAFLQQIPSAQHGGALWNLAMQYKWPEFLPLDRFQSSGARIRSAVMSYVAVHMLGKMDGLLSRTSQKSRNLELKSVELIAEMEWNGFRLNRRECESMISAVLKEMTALENEGYKLAGCRFSFDSPRRISEVLFVKLGIPAPAGSNGKTHFATNAAVLQQIEHPLAKLILRWRKLQNALTVSSFLLFL